MAPRRVEPNRTDRTLSSEPSRVDSAECSRGPNEARPTGRVESLAGKLIDAVSGCGLLASYALVDDSRAELDKTH